MFRADGGVLQVPRDGFVVQGLHFDAPKTRGYSAYIAKAIIQREQAKTVHDTGEGPGWDPPAVSWIASDASR